MRGNHYYVQHLTEYIFLIRERMTGDGEPGPNDRIVQSFADHDDAYRSVSEMNDRRRQLDEHQAENDAQTFIGDDDGDLFRELGPGREAKNDQLR